MKRGVPPQRELDRTVGRCYISIDRGSRYPMTRIIPFYLGWEVGLFVIKISRLHTCNVIKDIVPASGNADNNTSRVFRITGSKQNVSLHKINKLVRSIVREDSVVFPSDSCGHNIVHHIRKAHFVRKDFFVALPNVFRILGTTVLIPCSAIYCRFNIVDVHAVELLQSIPRCRLRLLFLFACPTSVVDVLQYVVVNHGDFPSVRFSQAVPNILIALVEPLRQRNHVPLVVVGHRVRKLHLVAVEWNRVWIKQNKRSPRRFASAA